MLIKRQDVFDLSNDIRKIIDGQDIDLRDNLEGAWSILKNDIHTLAHIKKEQADSFQYERDLMSDTLANISHQLKTPLTAMMIMADLLENAPADKQAAFIANLKTGLLRMEWLVSALLKIARLDARAVNFSCTSLPAKELVRLALEPLQIWLDIRNQSVTTFCETSLSCDKKWTAEALTNVIKNASEHSPVGGSIRIASGVNPICQWISITDSGEGIPKHTLSRLFTRFEGSQNDKGCGIGLPLALAILRGQNGDMEVNGGGNGQGATFTLKFFK